MHFEYGVTKMDLAERMKRKNTMMNLLILHSMHLFTC